MVAVCGWHLVAVGGGWWLVSIGGLDQISLQWYAESSTWSPASHLVALRSFIGARLPPCLGTTAMLPGTSYCCR